MLNTVLTIRRCPPGSFPDGKCDLCDHTAMQHFSFFNKKIVIPIQAYGYVAEGKIAMLRLQNEVLQHVRAYVCPSGNSLEPRLLNQSLFMSLCGLVFV